MNTAYQEHEENQRQRSSKNGFELIQNPNPLHLDKNQQTLKQEGSSDFHFSPQLNCYVAREPLRIDDRVVRAAASLGIELEWDDQGRICNITYLDAKRLLGALGSTMLSAREYWLLHEEAVQSGDQKLQEQLHTDNAAEWLDNVFVRSGNGRVEMIEHPQVSIEGELVSSKGKHSLIAQPIGRPGWFNPESNINPETGIPEQVKISREKGSPSWSETTWKYWSTFLIDRPVAAIRGYVTSSGTPSLDMDIPVTAKNPVLTIRECRSNLPAPSLNPKTWQEAQKIILAYETTLADEPAVQNKGAHDLFYEDRQQVLQFIERHSEEIRTASGKRVYALREKLTDMLGLLRLEAIRRDEKIDLQEIARQTKNLFPGVSGTVDFESLTEFLGQSRVSLQEAINQKRKIVFVMGHRNPDTDTAVSALFEAYRNQLIDPETLYVPVLQAGRMPDEIRRLLGDELTAAYVLEDEENYQQLKDSGLARWILVDHNRSEQQRFAVSLVDHHIMCDIAKKQDISKSWEMVGSCAAMIAQKFHGLGLSLDQRSARILHGTTLMDTEDRSPKKMTHRDRLTMGHLAELSGINDENVFFQDLMSHLLNTDDAERLFQRDYKEDWGIFGFAVAKVKGAFSPDGEELKPDLLKRLTKLAAENNKAKNFAMTVVKVVDYQEDNEVVNRERVYLVFNDYASPEFKDKVHEYFVKTIKHEFGHGVEIRDEADYVEFWGVGDQLSRKVIAPDLGRVVQAFNEYFYSPALDLHIRREFLEASPDVTRAAEKLGIDLYFDRQGRVINITFHEAKLLLGELGMKMLSLPEYWQVYNEVRDIHDQQMTEHLVSAGFVEFLDTVMLDYENLVHHPKLLKKDKGFEYLAERKQVPIPEAVPGLIYPFEINSETGLPDTVHGPELYGDTRTWRYWSPDNPISIPTRGHIFLLEQPSLDCKIHPDDALQNLGIRPCLKKVIPPNVEIEEQGKHLVVSIS